MGFWAGVAKGVDSIEAQRNLENERSDRKDATAKADARYEAALTIDAEKWKNTLAQQDYRVKQDQLAIDREDKAINDARILKLGLTGGVVETASRGTNTSSDSGTASAGTTKQDLTHTLKQLVTYGAKDSHLLNIAGGGNQVAADALKAFEALNTRARKDGNEIDVNDFLETAVMVTTPGEPFDLAKVAKAKGLTLEEIKSQSGLEEKMVEMFTQRDMSTINFGMDYLEPMDATEYKQNVDIIKGNMVDDMNNEIKVLRDSGDNPGRLERLNTAINSLNGPNPSYFLAFDLLGDEAILPFVGNERFMNANYGGDIQRAKERFLANQDSSMPEDEGIQDGSIANVLAQYGMTDADIPRFTQEEYNNAEEDPGTPYIYLDGVLRANKAILSRGPQGQVDPTTPEDTVADPAAVQTDEVFGELSAAQSRNANRASADRGFDNTPPVESSNSVGSQGRQRGGGDGIENVPYPFQSTTPEAVAARPQKEDRRTSPEATSIFPTREERAASNAASPNEYETPAPMQRATDERGARNDARAARNASKIEQEDGKLLLEYILDESTDPEMLDAMAQEFEAKYGVEAMMDLMEKSNGFQQRFFMQEGETPFWEK
tara:strand:- start:2298 stop:4112 length:1815 start_codon:yes stop_codon:yes gene_type:complete